jgi:uncharacterized protein YxjI
MKKKDAISARTGGHHMSRLYMQQKVFSLKDRFTIRDEYDTDVYYVEGEFLSLGKKLHIYNTREEEVAYIQQKLLTFLPRFHVFYGGILAAEIRKEFTFFRPSYVIEGPDWQVSGSFLEHDYEITHHGMPIVSVHKVWLSWGDAYEIDIEDGQDEAMVLSVVLAIDAVMDSEAASVSVSSGSSSNS